MPAIATEERLYTIDEYLEMEEQSLEKHEYYNAENTWNDKEATGLYQSIFLRSINCSINLKDIYRKVAFAKPPK